jgi:hypothetical protein
MTGQAPPYMLSSECVRQGPCVRFEPSPAPEVPPANGTIPSPGAANHTSTDMRGLSRSAATYTELATWLLAKETGGETDPPRLANAAERVGQKLSQRLGKSVSAAGAQALVARALKIARAEFPFLEGVSAGATPEECFAGLRKRVLSIEVSEVRTGLVAVLGILLDLLVGFIGEGLTLRLVRDVWPDLPLFEPTRSGKSDGQEAAS